ncbi:MAG: bifunctional N-acetylglucosamine-1-phosphate uridyltransferase/glucosamine-1-phosphate acetyltransferase [Deltaproteobacteria bacterium]|nr:bifunctional N-acetylglucosamine-1-phosphate uridyltransferase/glucosamine-1-phosphate acetyltransferase [Deltaproteobacteria bacterium]
MSPDEISRDVAGLVLAAGKGTRMKSALPKVLHPVCGRPMIGWTLSTLASIGVQSVVTVVSEDQPELLRYLRDYPAIRVAAQRNRQGTGDAVAAAAGLFAGVEPPPFAAGNILQGQQVSNPIVLILAGDVPGIHPDSLRRFLASMEANHADLAVLGMRVPQPHGYGRMVTKDAALFAIVEEKDASPSERAINLCNTGIMAARVEVLFAALKMLKPDNAQQEYYLTDCVKHARSLGYKVCAHETDQWQEFSGINDREQLASVASWLMARKRRDLMLSGVTIQQPESVYVEDTVEIGPDTVIESGCHLAGATRIAAGSVVGAGSVIKNVTVATAAVIPPNSVKIS